MTRPGHGTGRRWSIRAYLVLLVVVVLGTAAAAAWFVALQTKRDSRSAAVSDATFASHTAGKQLGQFVSLVQATVGQLATNPRIAQTFVHPAGCTLSFAGIGGPDKGHVDIVAPDGKVACSSRVPAGSQQASYANDAWIKQALTRPLFVAPVVDSATGTTVAISTSPIPGHKGFVAGFIDLESVGPALASLFSGGRKDEFVVTTSDGRAVIARSLNGAHWIGRSLVGTQFLKAGASTQRDDVDGTSRLYAKTVVPGVGWRFYVGEDAHSAFAAADKLERREFALVLAGLAAALLTAFVVMGRLVRPVRRLSRDLRATSLEPTPLPVAVGGPAEISALGADINGLIDSVNRELLERRRAEENAATSERNYRVLFDGNPSPMWVFDTETFRFLAVNDAAVASYGYTRDEFLAMTIEAIRPSEDRDRLRSHLDSAWVESDGLTSSGLWRHQRKDGTSFEVEISSHSHQFDGRSARVVLALDVTERFRAEQALRRSEAQYRDLFENATDLIATVDLNSCFTAVNAAFTRTLGYADGELIGQPLRSVVPEEWHDRLGIARDDKIDGELVGTIYTHELVAKDGRRIPVEVASRVIEEDGRPVGVEAICRDLTERRLLEDQLRQSQRLEAIGRLAGGVAHDFNNLLTVISGYTEALIEQGNDDEAREELNEIAAAAERAAILTRQLLAFSRRQVLQPRVVSVNEIVAGITPMLGRLIGEDVDLVAALDPAADPVLADPNQLEQVLVNLGVNARDAMPVGGKLTIETGTVDLDDVYVAQHPEATAGPHTMIAVSDTGSGMDAETLAHVFEPFFTTKPAGVGTGLGLSTVYGIVKQSGGSIWVYSEPGHGTTFKVYLPAVQDTEALERPRPGRSHPNGTETIMIVEDEEPLRKLVAERLRARGYNVLVAESSVHALQLADDNRIDLLLTDVVMPHTSGPELAEQICTRQPATQVLFMSGYADEAVVRNGALNPGATFLEKPFSSSELAQRVRETIDHSGDRNGATYTVVSANSTSV
jgi:two-component system, cell cycle sensor histidine kinase and response regulator CckA